MFLFFEEPQRGRVGLGIEGAAATGAREDGWFALVAAHSGTHLFECVVSDVALRFDGVP